MPFNQHPFEPSGFFSNFIKSMVSTVSTLRVHIIHSKGSSHNKEICPVFPPTECDQNMGFRIKLYTQIDNISMLICHLKTA